MYSGYVHTDTNLLSITVHLAGVIEYEGATIQLLDLPGIIEGASQGKGRGRQVIAVAKTADLM